MISMDRPEMESRPYEFLLQHKAENIHYLLAQLGPGVGGYWSKKALDVVAQVWPTGFQSLQLTSLGLFLESVTEVASSSWPGLRTGILIVLHGHVTRPKQLPGGGGTDSTP